MRALVHIGAGRLELREIAPPQAGSKGAVLRVEGSAACIADAETLHGYGPVMATPLVLGHEIVGRVENVGPDAPPSLKQLEGVRVLIDDARPCGTCEWCQRDQRRFCRSPRYGHIVQDDSAQNWGGYAEAVTLDARSVFVRIPESLPIELATYVFPVASAVEWLRLGASLIRGDRVAVLGTSRMGAASVLVALHDGASQVVMYGDQRGSDAITAVKAMGVEVRPAPDRPKAEGPYDVVVVVTEAPVEYCAAAVEMAAPLGRVIIACTATQPSGIEPETIRRKGLMLKGGRGASAQSLEAAVEVVVREQHRLNPITGAIYGFERAADALKNLLNEGVARGAHIVIAADPRAQSSDA
jgi:threonine dehydrogenase-like Zn-dependent dehydrogenase